MMFISEKLSSALFSGAVALLALSDPATAGVTVEVLLWDKGETSMDVMDTAMPMGMAMPAADMTMATMGITVDLSDIPAGEVTFEVTNDSQDFYHSIAIAPVADPTIELPYLVDAMMLDESETVPIAPAVEFRPHASGMVTVVMTPGTYIL